MAFFRALFLVSAILLVAPLAAQAQSPRAQFDQLVQQLQSKPDDNALRESIITLAIKLKPKPALSDEAERRMARGIAAFKAAQSAGEYQSAVTEFTQAALAAPWYGDAYYNLGVAQDKAEQYDAALHSLRLALLASPGSKEIKDITYQVEYRRDQAKDPEVRENREVRAAQENYPELIRKLEGAIFVDIVDSNPGRIGHKVYFLRKPFNNAFQFQPGSSPNSVPGYLLCQGTYKDGQQIGYWPSIGVKPKSNSEISGRGIFYGDFKLSEDGQTLTEEGGSSPSIYRKIQ